MSAAITLTRRQALALKPCDRNRVPKMALGQAMSASEALEAGVSIADLLWVAGRLGHKDLCVRFALACAQRVAHLNPDPRVQAALDDPSGVHRAAACAACAAAGAAGAARAAATDAEQQAQRALFVEIFG